ncbi:hypothetical protein C9374_009097 [Naegleria lovaniensis]|uniref:Diacylglycerol O-acyltransferase n=1 Tax=Naegleria lovaniensis TaxID=51637 RepID=A0AA88GI29_NAELO|nr:uncharacterized protein C9374_009097 [Naegleria lovaniensis]KAG2377581.1 hypothetical protein C9374_009097 [Naegleria lovaniensis]
MAKRKQKQGQLSPRGQQQHHHRKHAPSLTLDEFIRVTSPTKEESEGDDLLNNTQSKDLLNHDQQENHSRNTAIGSSTDEEILQQQQGDGHDQQLHHHNKQPSNNSKIILQMDNSLLEREPKKEHPNEEHTDVQIKVVAEEDTHPKPSYDDLSHKVEEYGHQEMMDGVQASNSEILQESQETFERVKQIVGADVQESPRDIDEGKEEHLERNDGNSSTRSIRTSNTNLVEEKQKGETSSEVSLEKQTSSSESAISSIAKKVVGTLPIRRNSIGKKDLSHITKMTLITDRPTNTTICSCLLTLAKPITHEELLSRLRKRVLSKYPRFRSIVSHDYQSFLEYENIDLEKHVRYLRVPKSGIKEYTAQEEKALLQEFLGKISMEPLDFSKPLWELIVIDNCPALGYLLMFRMHHAMGDGTSLLMFLSQFCDQGEEHFKLEIFAIKDRFLAKAVSKLESVPVIGLIVRFFKFLLFLFGLFLVFIKWMKLLILNGQDRSVFKTAISTEKRVGWSKPFDVSDIKHVGKTFNNATVNDVVLNSLSGALMRFTERRTDKESAKRVTFSMPVNIRMSNDEFEKLSNKFGFILVPVDLKTRDPVARLRYVKKVTDKTKSLPEPFFTYNFAKLTYILPAEIVFFLVAFLSKWITCVFTNVVGSSTELSADSIPVTEIVTFAPSPVGVGLAFAVSSYNGKLCLSAISDVLTVSDPMELITDFENDLEQIIAISKSNELGNR